MSRKSNTATRQAEIVAAMLKVIASTGYEKATIQAIAREADLTPGLIHYHFKEKRDIFIALVKLLSERVYQRYVELAADTSTAEQRLHAYLEARLGLGKGASADAVAAWVVVGSEAIRQTAVREVYQEAITAELALLRELLSAHFAEQRRSQKNVTLLAAVVMSFMEGAFQLSAAARKAMPKGYAADAAQLLIERFMKEEARA